jgi:hypothetical protein
VDGVDHHGEDADHPQVQATGIVSGATGPPVLDARTHRVQRRPGSRRWTPTSGSSHVHAQGSNFSDFAAVPGSAVKARLPDGTVVEARHARSDEDLQPALLTARHLASSAPN